MAVDTPIQKPDLFNQIKDIIRRVSLLERVNQLGQSALQTGRLRILDAANKIAVTIGISEDGTERGVFVFDDDGETITTKLTDNGLTVASGGVANVDGTMNVDGDIDLTGSLDVSGGGNVTIAHTGRLQTIYSNGVVSGVLGPIYNATLTELNGYGVLVQDIDGSDIFDAKLEVGTADRYVTIGQGSAQPVREFQADAQRVELNARGTSGVSDSWGLVLSSGAQVFIETTNDGNIILQTEGTGETFLHNYQTTSSAANMNLSGVDQGRIRRVTSARKYKANIESLSINTDSVMTLRPRVWQDKNELAENPDSTNWHVGFIAEEMVASGLSVFVNFDDEGNPDSIAYDRLSAALVPVIQEQESRITELEKLVSGLVPTGKAKGKNKNNDEGPKRPATTTKPKRIVP